MLSSQDTSPCLAQPVFRVPELLLKMIYFDMYIPILPFRFNPLVLDDLTYLICNAHFLSCHFVCRLQAIGCSCPLLSTSLWSLPSSWFRVLHHLFAMVPCCWHIYDYSVSTPCKRVLAGLRVFSRVGKAQFLMTGTQTQMMNSQFATKSFRPI